VNAQAGNLLIMHIAAKMLATIYHQHFAASIMQHPGDRGAS
jgi:hypothetical protein